MGHVSPKQLVDFKAYHFEKAEKALACPLIIGSLYTKLININYNITKNQK